MSKKFKKHKYIFLRTLFKILRGFDSGKRQVYDKNRVHRILLVSTTAIGDTLLSTPAIRAVRKAFPQAFVAVLSHEERKEILEVNPYISELISYPGKYKKAGRLMKRLRSREFDAGIVLHGNDPDIVPLLYLAGIPVRVGWGESRFSFLFTHTCVRPAEPTHLIRIRLNTVKQIGISDDGEAMDLFLSEKERRFADEFLRAKGAAGKKLIGIHPFGSHGSKQWPHIGAFLERAARKYPDHAFFVVGGGKEKLLAEAVRGNLAAQKNVFFAVGECRLRQTAALISRCACFMTTDSGPMQMSLALDVPTVVLAGPTDMRRTGPLAEDRHCIIQKEVACRPCNMKECDDMRCMDLIAVDDAMDALHCMLKRNPVPNNQRPAQI
jgi:lipopolysaccharide heptosyltransferase II